MSAFEELLAQSKEKAPDTAQIVIPPGERLGDLVVDAEHLNKGFGDKLLIEGTGAYTSTYSSVAFNGIPPLKTYHI